MVALPGTGTVSLPFVFRQEEAGDTAVFAAPAFVSVMVKDWLGNDSCDFQLYDPASGTELDFATATRGQNSTVRLDAAGHKRAYLALENCGIQVSAGR